MGNSPSRDVWDDLDDTAAEERLAKKKARKAQAVQADETVKGFKRPRLIEADSKLNRIAWCCVLEKLAAEHDKEGDRGTSAIARDYCSMAQTCQELRYLVITTGWPALIRHAKLTIPAGCTSDWDAIVKGHGTVKDFQDAAREASRINSVFGPYRRRIKTGGRRAELLLRLLDFLGLGAPVSVPAAIIFKVRGERLTMCRHAGLLKHMAQAINLSVASLGYTPRGEDRMIMEMRFSWFRCRAMLTLHEDTEERVALEVAKITKSSEAMARRWELVKKRKRKSESLGLSSSFEQLESTSHP